MSGTYPDAVTGMTGGHNSVDTSAEAARDDATSGRTSKRLNEVFAWLVSRVGTGGTVGELREISGLHHGQASSALTNLHRQGRIARLVEKRNHSHVYVATEFVHGRETQPVGTNKNAGRCPYDASVCAETERVMIDNAEALRSANARLAEIHKILGSPKHNGMPNLRLEAIREAIKR